MFVDFSILPSNENKYKYNKNFVKNKVTFKSYNPAMSKIYSKMLKNEYGIIGEFQHNDFLAKSVSEICLIFENFFGKKALPKLINYKEMDNAVYALYEPIEDNIVFNASLDKKTYDNLNSLNSTMIDHWHFFKPNDFSSKHPAHILVHEFAHCAHFHHMKERNGEKNALRVWNGSVNSPIPTTIGRLIVRFKLGNYAVQSKDFAEFMAERVAKDVCKVMYNESWCVKDNADTKYEDIFTRKWNKRYATPQSYIDYFAQQIWNGDIAGANEVGKDVGEYLKRLDTLRSINPRLKDDIAYNSEYQPILNDQTIFEVFLAQISNSLDSKNDIKLNL